MRDTWGIGGKGSNSSFTLMYLNPGWLIIVLPLLSLKFIYLPIYYSASLVYGGSAESLYLPLSLAFEPLCAFISPDFTAPGTISALLHFLSDGVNYWKRIIFYSSLVQVHQYPAHSVGMKNNMAPAPQRLVHNEKYAAIEHQGHRGGGFLKRAG